MRPVEKNSNIRKDGTVRTYKEHGDAKPELIENIGGYCSYCEIWSQKSHLEVEHVLCKKLHPHLSLDWNNFLLSCKNCNTVKGDEDLDATDVYLPHKANTFQMVSVLEGGLIVVNPDLNDPAMIAKAQRSIALTGQDRVPGHPDYSDKDDRWEHRKTAWDLAVSYLDKWEQRTTTIDDIIRIASQRGFWSIWMTVFKNHPNVRKAFIEDKVHFKGTAQYCFDATYSPVYRNGTDL